MGKAAYLFSGQGAQKPGMGKELFSISSAARTVFDAADKVLSGRVSALCFSGSAEELNDTRNTQIALLAVDLCAAAALAEQVELHPSFMAGFSLGEYAALTCAGVLELSDAFALIQKRAEFMSGCSPIGGGMAAVLSIDATVVEEICVETGAQSVNYNCPGQTVIAGLSDQLDRAIELAASKGGRAVKLPVSGAFHSTYMQPASALLAEELKKYTLHDAAVPVVSNTKAQSEASPVAWRALMPLQLCSPVRWEQSIRMLIADGVDTFIEFGPGGTLCGFLKRIDRNVRALRVEDAATLQATVAALKGD